MQTFSQIRLLIYFHTDYELSEDDWFVLQGRLLGQGNSEVARLVDQLIYMREQIKLLFLAW
jgi:hypothetical protein